MTTPQVDPILTVKNAGTDQQLFMSYALLNRLTAILGGPDNLPVLAVDTEMQKAILLEVFTERDKQGNVTRAVKALDEIEVSLDDIDRVVDFVGDHIVNFFTRAAEKAQARMQQIHERMEKMSSLMPTKTGS